jgi:hypothetical protein
MLLPISDSLTGLLPAWIKICLFHWLADWFSGFDWKLNSDKRSRDTCYQRVNRSAYFDDCLMFGVSGGIACILQL